MARSCMNIHVLLMILGTSLALASSNAFVLRHSGGTCIDIIKKANFEYVDLGTISEADCASRCEADAQCNFYQTLNQQAYNSGWPPLCQHYRNAYCDPATLTKNHPWWEVVIKESGLPPVQIVTSGPPMTASCSSQPLDYCLRTTWEGGDSPYAPSHNYIWRLADVLNGEPVFVQDGKETEYNGALGFIPDFNLGQNLAGYCAGQTWGAIVLDRSPGYPFINDGVWNWGVSGSCTGTETADILEVLRGQRESITTAFRARTNSYHAAHRDVKIEVLRDAIACGGRFYSDALFSKSESEQCKIMEAVLPGAPTNEPTASPTSEPSNMPTMNPTLVPTSDTFVLRHSGGTCIDIIKKANFEYVDLGTISEADCASRCEADAQCNFYQTLNQQAYNSGWPPLCQHYRNAYCDPATLTKNHPWWEVVIKESGLPPVQIVTSGPPMTASCSSQPLDYCLRTTWEGGDSPYAPSHNYIWRLADVLNGEPVFVQDGKETEHNGALGFIPDFNLGQNLAGYCAGQTWGAIVLDRSPGYPFINDGVWNWGVSGSCTGTETADILEVLRGQRESITTAFRARTNSYHAAHRDVKIEVLRDAIACGGRFYSDALFSKSESEQCKIMEAVLPGVPTNEPTNSPTSEPSNMPTMNPTLVPTSDVCTLGRMTAGGTGDAAWRLDRKYMKFNEQHAYDDYESAGSEYWHNNLGRTAYGSQTGVWPEGCMKACCANPDCQSFMMYKSECILFNVASSTMMDPILSHPSRQGPWGINEGGPGYSLAFWEMSRKSTQGTWHDDILGGHWTLVRRVKAGNNWHPSTDQLMGTDVYGSFVNDPTADATFSKAFDINQVSEFLFATGDGQKWLVASKDSVVGGFYANEVRPIMASSKSGTAHSARWYRRNGVREDPWISLSDHHPAIGAGDILYGGDSFGHTHASAILPHHNGANVFVRFSNPSIGRRILSVGRLLSLEDDLQ